jgi:hypothetical protein
MEKNKIAFKNNEAFFRLFLEEGCWEEYRSNMSNWLSLGEKDGSIRKRVFIEAINEKLGLTPDIWGASEVRQKEAVIAGVAKFKRTLNQEEALFPWVEEAKVSEEQEAFLDFVKQASLKEIEEKVGLLSSFFEKTSANQSFLIVLFSLMYERGEYVFVYSYVFPHLLDTYDNNIKSKKADIYASLPTPMYREAFEILNSIKGETKAETVDLQTSAISNIRRERLSSTDLSKEELKTLLKTLIQCYTKIYVPKQEYSYYPGINLAYMVALANHIFPDAPELVANGYSVKQIYSDVTKSIVKGKETKSKEDKYYASMSDIEFQLLLNRQGMGNELEFLLDDLSPSHSMIHHTKRQMGTFFMQIVETFSDASQKDLSEFKHFLELFQSYALSRA